MRLKYKIVIRAKHEFKDWHDVALYRTESEDQCLAYLEMFQDVRFALYGDCQLIHATIYFKNSKVVRKMVYRRNAYGYGTCITDLQFVVPATR